MVENGPSKKARWEVYGLTWKAKIAKDHFKQDHDSFREAFSQGSWDQVASSFCCTFLGEKSRLPSDKKYLLERNLTEIIPEPIL